MPHTSHRRRQPARPQRIKTTDANGWTTIQHGPKLPAPPPPSPFPTPIVSHPSPISPIPPLSSPSIPSSDLQALITHYAQYKSLWSTSTCAATLRSILAERVRRNDISELENCVVLGLGSLSSASAPAAARKSLLQLAALEDVRECLSVFPPSFTRISVFVSVSVYGSIRYCDADMNAGSHFPHLRYAVYAQDPAFEALDVAFLAMRGVTVLQVPGASEMVGRGTVVYAPHCVRGVYLDALGAGIGGNDVAGDEGEGVGKGERGVPALVVGNDVKALIDGTIETPPSMKRIGEAFLDIEGRRSVVFPRFEADETVFWDMRVYWRERGDESGDGEKK